MQQKQNFGNLPEKRFLLVDGMALVFRGFYAIPPLSTADGKPTNAVYGFFLVLFNLIWDIKPTHICICFDRKETTNRKEIYEAYKATRTKAPDALYEQIPFIKEGINNMHLNLVERAGIEADDLIATIATKNSHDSTLSIIYTGDLDLLQLANHWIKILTPANQKQGLLMGSQEVQDKYGFLPEQIPDYKGLHGDSSDNLPGIKGVGPKTATQLLQTYKTLEGIYDNLEALPEKLQQKFNEHKDIAFLCKQLATLDTNLEYETASTNFSFGQINITAAKEYLEKFELNSLKARLDKIAKLIPDHSSPTQMGLF